ncbi:MAG: hypothetical protein WAS36_02870 [Candidatus Saccharimonadales bacterium]
MPQWITNAEHEQYKANERTLATVNEILAGLRVEHDELQVAFDGLQAAVEVSDRVAEALERNSTTTHLNAVDEATRELIAESEEEYRKDVKEGYKATHREEARVNVRATKGEQIREEERAGLELDGTLAKIEEDAEAEFRREVIADEIDKEKKAKEAEIDTPENREAFLQENAPAIKNDPRVVKHGERFRAAKEKEWTQEGQEIAMAQAEHEVLQDEDKIKDKAAKDYAKTWEGKDRIERIQESARRKISEMSVQELLGTSEDKTYQALLKKAQDVAARELAITTRGKELALTFTNGGIETDKIPKDTTILVQLGSVKEEDVVDEDAPMHYYGNQRPTKKAPVKIVKRELKLTSMGDGFFVVDHDTLARSKHDLAPTLSLEQGDVIKIGILMTKKEKDGRKKREILPVLRAGVNLQYDTDTSTPDVFTDTKTSVVNVQIGGVDARAIKHTRTEYQ